MLILHGGHARRACIISLALSGDFPVNYAQVQYRGDTVMDAQTETLSQLFARLWRERYGTEPFALPNGQRWIRTDKEIMAEAYARKGGR